MPTNPTPPKRPTPPKTDHLVDLLEALETARQTVIDLCWELTDPARLATWTSTPAVDAWYLAAEAWNDAVTDAAADVRTFIEDHSQRWIESTRGQAYEAWADALEEAGVETEPIDTLQLSLRVDLATGAIESTVENAEDVLPEIPTFPELEE